jgi:hypothetical protein
VPIARRRIILGSPPQTLLEAFGKPHASDRLTCRRGCTLLLPVAIADLESLAAKSTIDMVLQVFLLQTYFIGGAWRPARRNYDKGPEQITLRGFGLRLGHGDCRARWLSLRCTRFAHSHRLDQHCDEIPRERGANCTLCYQRIRQQRTNCAYSTQTSRPFSNG